MPAQAARCCSTMQWPWYNELTMHTHMHLGPFEIQTLHQLAWAARSPLAACQQPLPQPVAATAAPTAPLRHRPQACHLKPTAYKPRFWCEHVAAWPRACMRCPVSIASSYCLPSSPSIHRARMHGGDNGHQAAASNLDDFLGCHPYTCLGAPAWARHPSSCLHRVLGMPPLPCMKGKPPM